MDTAYEPRLVLGTYQKLAYLKNNDLVILSPQQKVATFKYNPVSNEQVPGPVNKDVTDEAIAQYQTAYYLFKHEGLKQKNKLLYCHSTS